MEKSAQFVPKFQVSKAQFLASFDFGLIDGTVAVTFNFEQPSVAFEIDQPSVVFEIDSRG